ncbi:MAG: cytochrome c [Caldilineaceae bacterium]|nr:cytochrome c [Caldilineaceae bacterium]
MNKRRNRWIGLVVLLSILLGTGLLAIFSLALPYGGMMGGISRGWGRTFASNGERIYFTATSQRQTSITSDISAGRAGGNMPMMMGGSVACADCHGPDGRGGRQQMMMTSFTAPDIRWQTLTAADHGATDEHEEAGAMEHPPYTEATLKRAITQGVNPAGEPLAWPMPQWRMSDEDLNDLIGYLQTLE